MKVFLDIEGCVFVLACDYQVVSSGLRAKFGQGGSDLKGRHFFDKIIQLPFSMPSAQLDITAYLQRRLEACGIGLGTLDRAELALYEGLLSSSVGFNPRSLKRLSNCLHVLRIVAEKKGILAPVDSQGNRKERERALFAALCLQTAFEPIYMALIEIAAGGWEAVMNAMAMMAGELGKKSSPATTNPVMDGRMSKALKTCEAEQPGAITALAAFAAALHRALQIESGNNSQELESSEVAMFVGMLRFSSITATVSNPREGRVRIDFSAASKVLRSLQPKLRAEHTPKTFFSEGDGCWVAPIIAGIGFMPYLGFLKTGSFGISIDIDANSDSKARANARAWALSYFGTYPQFVNRVQIKKGNALYGAVFVQLEPDGFASQSEEDLRSKVLEHAEKFYLPFVKHLINEHSKSRLQVKTMKL